MNPTEYEEQVAFVQWLELKGLKFSSVPNSTWTSSIKQKVRNKATGLRPGLPDLLVIVGGSLVFIEMKRVKGGVVSPAQRDWIEALNQVSNVQAFVCKGADEAIEIVESFSKPMEYKDVTVLPSAMPHKTFKPHIETIF